MLLQRASPWWFLKRRSWNAGTRALHMVTPRSEVNAIRWTIRTTLGAEKLYFDWCKRTTLGQVRKEKKVFSFYHYWFSIHFGFLIRCLIRLLISILCDEIIAKLKYAIAILYLDDIENYLSSEMLKLKLREFARSAFYWFKDYNTLCFYRLPRIKNKFVGWAFVIILCQNKIY